MLSTGQIEHLASGFTKAWRRPPTEAELKGLIDDWVRDEIAVREAMAAGFDRDDTIIRRRLRQKLDFLAENLAEMVAPTDRELQAWLPAHAESFRSESRVAFRQVYVSRGRRGASAEGAAGAILARLKAAGAGARIDNLGDSVLLPQEVDLAPRREIDSAFGSGFAERIAALAPGMWIGPIPSGYGLHLVLVRERVDGSVPDLASVRPAVERELVAARRKRQLDAMYQRLLEKYTVIVEKPAGATPDRGTSKAGL